MQSEKQPDFAQPDKLKSDHLTVPIADNNESDNKMVEDQVSDIEEASAGSKEPVYRYDNAKYREIISHLKTVVTVSVISLLILGGAYYLELEKNWVEKANREIKSFLAHSFI